MKQKEITVAFYARRFPRADWCQDLDPKAVAAFFESFAVELAPLGIVLRYVEDDAFTLDINGYGDLLNAVRLRAPQDGFGNLCLGHVIGASPRCDLLEDIRRGVNRIAFAPETVEPEGSDKVVCHNCGCGC